MRISHIKPPRGSRLEQVWNEPVSCEFLGTPLTRALQQIAAQTDGKLKFDLSRLPAGYQQTPMNFTINHAPLKNALGLFFSSSSFFCRLEEDTITLKLVEQSDLANSSGGR
jgi:hypothetical protein